MNQPQNVREGVSLAKYTTLKIGGSAKAFVEAKSDEGIIETVLWAKENDLPLFVLGGGSNLLVSDDGFNGLVLRICTKGIDSFHSENSYINISVQAGEDWDEFVEYCVSRKYQGIECLSGIPGTVGASPVQNIGAYGQEVAPYIVSVKCFDRVTEKIVILGRDDCKFAYRSSIFNMTEKDRYLILAVCFSFPISDFSDSSYKDLQTYFGGRKPTLAEMREAVIQIRGAKSMIIDEIDPNSKSAGSFFKNPIVSNEKLAKIIQTAKNSGIENVPSFLVNKASVKIPAAWLIERSGFHKGFTLGSAGLSTKHTLAIINKGNATARDILNLKNLIQKTVREKFEVELIPEPNMVGFK